MTPTISDTYPTANLYAMHNGVKNNQITITEKSLWYWLTAPIILPGMTKRWHRKGTLFVNIPLDFAGTKTNPSNSLLMGWTTLLLSFHCYRSCSSRLHLRLNVLRLESMALFICTLIRAFICFLIRNCKFMYCNQFP